MASNTKRRGEAMPRYDGAPAAADRPGRKSRVTTILHDRDEHRIRWISPRTERRLCRICNERPADPELAGECPTCRAETIYQ